jgi:RHS repeat-associated protein
VKLWNCEESAFFRQPQFLDESSKTRVAQATFTSSFSPMKPACAANGFTLTSQYLLDLSGDQVTELNGVGVWQHSNAFSGGRLALTYDNQQPGIHYAFSDPLGTKRVQEVISSTGTGVVELNCLSLPFGNDIGNPRATNCQGPAADATEHHFTGKERDTESGNDYFEARYYASSMGRFLSPDWSAKVMPVPYVKLDNPQTLNLYAYVGNNPLTRTDPTGHYLCNGKECDQVKAALQTAQEAIDSGKLSKNEVKALKGVISFYGEAGKDNGVTVNTGVQGLTSEGGVGKTVTENGKTTISLNMGALDKTVNQGSPEVEKSATVMHEGEHGVQNLANGSPTTPEQQYAAEQGAYTVQSYVNKGLSSDSDRNLWTSSGGFNQNAVNENAADSTRMDIGNPNWRSPDEQ